jgi:predicted amidohydrolase YtcJ
LLHNDIPEIISRMKEHAPKVSKDAWIVGMGYQPLKMKENRHPTADELDEVSKDRPVLIVHSSGHGGSMNHALMKLLGIDEKTKDPAGGEYLRVKGGQMPLGGMEETALIEVRNKRPALTGESAAKVIQGAAEQWVSFGETTAMECGLGLGADDISIVENAIDKNLLPIDLVCFAKESETDNVVNSAYGVSEAFTSADTGAARKLMAARADLDKRYINRVRLGGIKFWLDGNPQVAWMSEPYATPPPGRKAGYKAYGQIPDSVLFSFFDKYWTSNMQINMHVMGDQAVEQALQAIEAAVKKHGMSDHRPVFVHCGYARPDQIARIKAVGGIPTFLSNALVLQGDQVVKMWGAKRAANGMAGVSMLKAGIHFTLSHDAPITPPAILPLISAAVNRTTLSGNVIGPDQRVTPYQGLQAVTSSAAYQIKEEKNKGTLEVGKLADLVILEQNPLKVDPKTIGNIKVMQTIKEGKTVYMRKEGATAMVQHSNPDDHAHESGGGRQLLTNHQKKTLAMLVRASH